MDDLIRRLEDAQEPSRELDLEIAIAAWGRPGVLVTLRDDDGTNREHTLWEYTKSIDAALTLVPDGLTWNAGITDEHFEGPIIAFAKVMTREYLPEGWQARAATPAIALCIAALAARPKRDYNSIVTTRVCTDASRRK